jgi:hypothetical protein
MSPMGAFAPIVYHLIIMSLNQKEIEYYQKLVKDTYPDKESSNKDYYRKSVGKATICGKEVGLTFCDVVIRKKKRAKNAPKKIPDGQSLLLSRRRTMRKVIDLVNSNVGYWPKKNGKIFPPIFLTLTFSEEVRLFKGRDKILQYIAVPEFQKNGRVHYHVIIFNLPFSKDNYKIARDVWGHGFIWMKTANQGSAYNLSRYLSKYLIKACDDPRLYKKRKYFPSAKLIRPIVLKGLFVSKSILEAMKIKFPGRVKYKQVEVDFVGNVDCYFLHLKPNEEISDLLPLLDPYTRNVLQLEIDKQRANLNL